MAEGKKKNETAADLALIGAAQKVEHCEMSGIVGIGKGGVFPGLPEIGRAVTADEGLAMRQADELYPPRS